MDKRQVTIQLPAEIRKFSTEKRIKIAVELMKGLGLDADIRGTSTSTARNFVKDYNDQMQRVKSIWHPHENALIADLEDMVYSELAVSLWNMMLDLYDALGLEYPTYDNLVKSFNDEDAHMNNMFSHKYHNTAHWDIDLQKSDDDDYTTMDDVNRRYKPRDPQGQRSRKSPSIPYKADGNSFTQQQLQTLDSVLRRYKVNPSAFAERVAVSGMYLGQLLSAFEEDNERLRQNIVKLLPVTLEDRKELNAYALTQKEAEKFNLPLLPLQDQEINEIEWYRHNGGTKIGEFDEKMIQQLRGIVINARRNRVSPKELEQLLFDKFGDINRDFRRIALTEVAEATNNGYLMTLPHLQTVTILGADNACKFCSSMQAGEYIFVDTKKVDVLDWDKMVWVGKSNYGRRSADWKPCCPAHPHCRDRYVKYNTKFQKVDKDQNRIVLKNRDEIIGDAITRKLSEQEENES